MMGAQAQDGRMLTATLPHARTVSYAVYGDPLGQPVLALHGAPACRLMFALGDAAARKAGLKLVAPDRPGYGGTLSDADPSLGSRARWLLDFAEAVGFERFAVFGISGGAPYAVAVAALAPQRVRALALVSPLGPVADYVRTPEAAAMPVPFLQRRFFLHLGQRTWLTAPAAGALAMFARRMPQGSVGLGARIAGAPDAGILAQANVRAALTIMMREAFRQGGAGAAADLAIYGRPWGLNWAAITAPAIVWQGGADTIVPVGAARYLAQILPNCRLEHLRGAGHFWVLLHMEEVLQRVRALCD